MRGAVRIALAYFSAVPLQRFTSGTGAILILVALAMRALSPDPFLIETSALLLALGGVFIVLVPAMMGGGMMRAASTRIILHQRPWGRQRMLLGATLTVTIVAVCGTLLVIAMEELKPGTSLPRPALEVLAIAWSLVAATWVCVFIATGNRLLSVLLGFVPLAIIKFGETLFGQVPDARLLVILSVILWTCFSLWYLRAGKIRQLVYSKARQEEVYDNRFNRFFQWVTGAARPASPARAMEAYLLGLSPLGSFVIGVYFVIIAAFMHLVFGIYTRDAQSAELQALTPFYFLPVILLSWAVMGFALARRARVLWLRAGLDRMQLFWHVERSALLGGLLGFGVCLVALLLYSLAKWPENQEAVIMFVAVQIPSLACIFYGGLSLTRGLAEDAPVAVGLCALLAAQILILRPWTGVPSPVAPLVLGVALVLVPILRWHARRRWLSLDWRVARVWQFPPRV